MWNTVRIIYVFLTFQLNVTDIFDENKSDLNGILENREKLAVTAAVQKANVKVDETGTEAAAANGMVFIVINASIFSTEIMIGRCIDNDMN